MVNINSTHPDEIFHNMEQSLDKTAKTFMSEQEYRSYLSGMSCEQLKQYNPRGDRVPGEKQMIYNMVKRQKCSQGAEDKVAVDFAIKYIAKIADELDKNGFIEVANVLDETLQKFAALKTDCEDCK